MGKLILIIHNVRSAHNVGSLLRTADGLGVDEVILTGISPYPQTKNDDRLPHESQRTAHRIHKTALGAENSVRWQRSESIGPVLADLKDDGWELVALEKSAAALPLSSYRAPKKVALIVGSEIDGIDKTVLKKADLILEIPMRGRKESFNVAAAAAMALYQLTLLDKSYA